MRADFVRSCESGADHAAIESVAQHARDYSLDTQLVTARTVADWAHVKPKTVLRWTREGILPGFRLPSGSIRYRMADLENWLHEQPSSEIAAATDLVRHEGRDRDPSQSAAKGKE